MTEAGDYYEQLLDDIETLKLRVEQLKEDRAAVIEECAKVAEDMGDKGIANCIRQLSSVK